VKPEEVIEETWKNLVGTKIFFWSWTLTRVSTESRDRYFIFHTVSDIGFYKIHKMLTTAYPDWYVDRWSPFKYGKGITLPIPYIISHAIEIKTPEPITWLELMEKVTVCLENEISPKK
jgi:hypothetical protein